MPTKSPPPAADADTMNVINEIVAESAVPLSPTVGVTVENVVKTFQDTPALHGVSLEVGAG